MLVIGIDLAGVETRPSGFCVLDTEKMKVKTSLLYTDDEILHEINKMNAKVVAIDAPLSLPNGRRSLEERSDIHLRRCDEELKELGIKFFPLTLGPMRKLTKRGIELKLKLDDLAMEVIEVYPGGAQDVLGIPRKKRGLDKLLEGLRKLGIKGLGTGMNDDELDAVTAAFVGKLYVEGKHHVLGDPEEGLMIMPWDK
jgi:hypothetical protein